MTPPKNCQFSQVAEHKISVQKSVMFLYTNNKLFEEEIKTTIPFVIALKRIKYLRINLIQEVKDVDTENQKID